MAQNSSEDMKNSVKKIKLIVDAKLLDIGIPAPKPGIVYTISLMHYEVLKVIQGEYSHHSIFVGHHLPNLAGFEFQIDTHHRLHLTKKFPEHASILDKFQSFVSKTERFFCISFEVIGSGLV